MASETHEKWEEFYLGSRFFMFVANATGMPIDQVNFVLGQFFALIGAYFFRVYFHPSKTSKNQRHWISLLGGLGLSYFCYGRQTMLAIILAVTSYAFLVFLPPTVFHRATLVTSMLYLSLIHIQRQIYEDGVFVLDVTSTLMIFVQKVTALAFSLHDGLTKKEEELTKLQKELVVRNKPTPLEYFSYLLNFHSLLAGPFFMFADYQDFIEGTNYSKRLQNTKPVDSNSNSSEREVLSPENEPNPTNISLSKVGISLLCMFTFIFILPLFPVGYVLEPEFYTLNFVRKLGYIVLVTTLTRPLYYTGWVLGDAVCNMSGLGFRGCDADGKYQWDLVSNVDIIRVEFGLSLRDTLDSWNSGTMRWLRFLVYERAGAQKTVLTYFVSSVWHGFYPGYYFTFLAGAMCTIAARYARRSFRPHFLNNPAAKNFYDFATFLTTRLFLGYITISFILLRFWASVQVYWSMYFSLHILIVFAIYGLPAVLPPPPKSATSRTTQAMTTNSSSDSVKQSWTPNPPLKVE
ncbi:lysophospholipid acyltransferase 6 [Oratosquilla oratoria]|uniref:lysophospholipid acyltransferase 6 n=1 Tax=Oratosquilla oratoria TaxID=337810 RepID=UPI003F769853